MDVKQIKKSILLFLVFSAGLFFLLGSAIKTDKGSGQEFDTDEITMDFSVERVQNVADNQRYKESSRLNHVNKIKFDKLMKEKEAKRFEIHERNEGLYGDVGTPLSEEDNEIEIARLEKEVDNITKEIDDLLEEGNKTCFPKNTKVVMYDGSLKSIDTITKGDRVMIYDIANDTIGTSSVNEKYIDNNNHVYILNNAIQATAYERFLTQDGWKRINSITAEDNVFNGNSFISVNSISKVKKDLTVYNLNINSAHNFFVSYGQDDEFFLIHNSSGGGSSGGGGGEKWFLYWKYIKYS